MKIAAVLTLAATASAFAPATTKSARTTVAVQESKADLEVSIVITIVTIYRSTKRVVSIPTFHVNSVLTHVFLSFLTLQVLAKKLNPVLGFYDPLVS